jgi:hypothetical protein
LKEDTLPFGVVETSRRHCSNSRMNSRSSLSSVTLGCFEVSSRLNRSATELESGTSNTVTVADTIFDKRVKKRSRKLSCTTGGALSSNISSSWTMFVGVPQTAFPDNVILVDRRKSNTLPAGCVLPFYENRVDYFSKSRRCVTRTCPISRFLLLIKCSDTQRLTLLTRLW